MNPTNRLTSPPDALGALYFLPGQYLFKRIEGAKETVKALSSQQIARAFREYRIDTGWISRKILRYREEPEGNFILLYEPAGKRTIFVETEGGEVAEITIPLPTLILFGRAKEFYLWAAKGKTVNAKNKLFVAPLPNIGGNSSGKICFGKTEIPEARVDTLDEVWNLIWDSPFNRDHSTQKCRSQPNDVRRLLVALAKKNARRFPNSELLEINATIEDLWRQAVEKNHSSNF
jgi:PRTRC genetic system protein B